MNTLPTPSRRAVIAALLATTTAPALAQGALDAIIVGLIPDLPADQTQAMQAAIDRASAEGRTLALPKGTFRVQNLTLRSDLSIEGQPGLTTLQQVGSGAIARLDGQSNLTLQNLIFIGAGGDVGNGQGLLEIANSTSVTIARCRFATAPHHAISVLSSSVRITDCDIEDVVSAGIFSMDSLGVTVTGTTITTCANGGILIWRSAVGHDGSILANNTISNIATAGGGNGQNGNGINVFRANEVIIADNQISDCSFSAVRLNSTVNTQVTGNICTRLGEIAIFSEFAFSGSIIANNIIDGAATGISITNFDQGGQLAVCTGNIVRNIAPSSATNPDANPIGIYAEADTAITGNTVQGVPGFGIIAGIGPYLRNVLVSNNVISDVNFGVGASVAPDAGTVSIMGNIIDARRHDVVGLRWREFTSTDLASEAAKFPHVTIAGNS